MIRTTLLSFVLFLTFASTNGTVFAEEIQSILGYKAKTKSNWTYFDSEATAALGVQQEAVQEIRKIGERVSDARLTKMVNELAKTGFDVILLGDSKNDLNDNINIRVAQGALPNSQAEALQMKLPMQMMLSKIFATPVTMNSTELVQLPKSKLWALRMEFHAKLEGHDQHQVQYLVGEAPGGATRLVVGGTFFTDSTDSHRKTMKNFMTDFQLLSDVEKSNLQLAKIRNKIEQASASVGF